MVTQVTQLRIHSVIVVYLKDLHPIFLILSGSPSPLLLQNKLHQNLNLENY